MERTLKLILAYEGTDFHGWQRQRGVRTVQAELERVVQEVLRHPVEAVGASRTDAGVHAQGQVASVITEVPIPATKLRQAVGEHLPSDAALLHVEEVPAGFHPTRDALSKLYRYRIHHSVQRPVVGLASRLAWHVWYPLDLEAMRLAAADLVGTHDYAAFESQGSPRETTVRTVRRIEMRRRFDDLLIDVEGDGFLYNQVRNLVGTLVEIGRGHWPVQRAAQILASCDRCQAGPPAPAAGLCLQWVRYAPQRLEAHETD